MRYELYNIGSTQADYEKLLSVFEQLQTDPSPQSVICLERWFDASMCAVLGALLEDLSHVTVTTENQNIRSILCKNRFLLQYGEPWEADTYNTTIPYRRCTPEETLTRESIQSVQKLLNLEGFPTTSPSLQRSISQSIFELFDNVRVHSRSPVVCTCGQHYPKKHLIDFVIVDRGIGFYECIREQRPSISNALEAILWALEEGNTTKLSIC
ncbi:MAG: hypothetical protein Q4E67_06690, partial [Planctomycetia bacterium]|nr:hypothetical protein [Planctomycetia bacterium]